ncbi:ester cyclase [Nocardioides panzhihuensis]|uniref:Putative ester cyclase n=1 Tax=Nocardioides panzhihuensis TaxID=860243 RepID=A0A7Z0DP24_9ACTN|nr:ester cyclase [Nocardioides panzhihuensis]NYI78898.1 putative ester cyclase [Nocardioides panzhihuensis]
MNGFTDACDYIEKVTYAIWNGPERDPELVRRYYGAQTPIHADGGDLVGADRVLQNTVARLRTFPDFDGVIDDTIWTGDEHDGYRTSMRWTWTGTNTGESVFGPPTGKRVRFSAIANCVVRGDQIVEEWLSSNPLSLARQLGVSADVAGMRWSDANPSTGAGARPTWEPKLDGAGLTVAETLVGIFNERDAEMVARNYREDAVQHLGTDRSNSSVAAIARWFQRWLDRCPDLVCTIDDSYWRPEDGTNPDRVATQWTLRGEHRGTPFRIACVSHHHLRDGRIVAEWTEYDELALLRQCGDLIQTEPN